MTLPLLSSEEGPNPRRVQCSSYVVRCATSNESNAIRCVRRFVRTALHYMQKVLQILAVSCCFCLGAFKCRTPLPDGNHILPRTAVAGQGTCQVCRGAEESGRPAIYQTGCCLSAEGCTVSEHFCSDCQQQATISPLAVTSHFTFHAFTHLTRFFHLVTDALLAPWCFCQCSLTIRTRGCTDKVCSCTRSSLMDLAIHLTSQVPCLHLHPAKYCIL